eukprot:CAMPEP_0203966424 /NCGR_PEP_ID=MMETSP0359-20131031/95667_1 /ASSEMBLY_ACC=CAM_ASM_000338 /TAXON_ID=268821 /ORGANISM="Scrippsiella Hangoei, Strain SHTV-5" /LENGTH=43 /DNA_ID= /DNA_START= /DNA_END= /DNA_ORIENTATION=
MSGAPQSRTKSKCMLGNLVAQRPRSVPTIKLGVGGCGDVLKAR